MSLNAILRPKLNRNQSNDASNEINLYDIEINALNGQPVHLETFRGKYLLFVNVASQCGFTKQYKALQDLQNKYNDKLQIIGVPCNQFGGQEPGNAEDIKNFCSVNYGVSFLITEKIEVKGNNQHPLYQWLTQKKYNKVKSSSIRWNFQKYLISPDGKLIDYYYSITQPNSSKILKHLN
ncbi:glutathione peroxidase [Tamlana fucoidanivorans]|uniref:Glutathione peroxidase n=1 Tax=Allotamlana fucoidanivorans TaxID=2583814 RepID=A0A5C4SGK8_9FLAO|nr:glutathione peroxidase [Tamlana fucoidanivorans]TNJ42458.1 glutathione peroxidase [Tamlana fucoidanivorans]